MTDKTITWFRNNPDSGPECICSLCGRPISEGQMSIHYRNDKNPEWEARFHVYPCLEEVAESPESYTGVSANPTDIAIFTDPPANQHACDHVWDGPAVEEDNMSTATCSKCGMWAINYWMWYGP